MTEGDKGDENGPYSDCIQFNSLLKYLVWVCLELELGIDIGVPAIMSLPSVFTALTG